jgi:hypothetical protein
MNLALMYNQNANAMKREAAAMSAIFQMTMGLQANVRKALQDREIEINQKYIQFGQRALELQNEALGNLAEVEKAENATNQAKQAAAQKATAQRQSNQEAQQEYQDEVYAYKHGLANQKPAFPVQYPVTYPFPPGAPGRNQ